MRRTLIALAAAITLATPLITLAAVPAARADTTLYCFKTGTGQSSRYIGSAPSGSQVPMNTSCIVEFARVNFLAVDGEAYYEYENITGPDVGLCLKEDPGINDSYGHPVVDYECDNSGGATQKEEEFSDPPYPQTDYDDNVLRSAAALVWAILAPDTSWSLNPA